MCNAKLGIGSRDNIMNLSVRLFFFFCLVCPSLVITKKEKRHGWHFKSVMKAEVGGDDIGACRPGPTRAMPGLLKH